MDERKLPRPKDRLSRVVLEGLIVAYGTHMVATRVAARRAIAELRSFRPRLKGLLEALSENTIGRALGALDIGDRNRSRPGDEQPVPDDVWRNTFRAVLRHGRCNQ